MPLRAHPWMLVAGIYLLGLTHGLAELRTRHLRARRGIVLYLSVLGIGLFSYYQGRSHDFNLVHTCWPALMVALLLGDRLLLGVWLGQVSRLAATITFPIMAVGMASAFCVGQFWPVISDLHRRQRQAETRGDAPEQADAVAYLQRTVAPGEACLILSPYQALYHAETGRSPALTGPSLFECLLQADLEDLLRQLRTRRVPQVFFEDEPGQLDFRNLLDPGLTRTLARYYRLTGSNPAGNLLRWVPRTDAEMGPDGDAAPTGEFVTRSRLTATPPTALHAVGLKEFRPPDPRRLHHTVIPPNLGEVDLGGDFAVEVRCTPDAPQTPLGCVLSNHPGDGHDGFTIQQDGGAGDNFVCAFGDGAAFTFSAPFPLVPDQEHYLVVSHAGKAVSVYLDGRCAQRFELPNPVSHSRLLFTIGDWVGQTRPFRGTIHEVKIHRGAVSDAQVEANWRGLKAAPDPAPTPSPGAS